MILLGIGLLLLGVVTGYSVLCALGVAILAVLALVYLFRAVAGTPISRRWP